MTNFRNAYKSDHLGVVDIKGLEAQGHDLIFTIKKVTQHLENSGYKVAGNKGKFNVVHFSEENMKPWVLNSGNAHILFGWVGSQDVEEWVNLKIQLYIDPSARMKGEITGGVRINPKQPNQAKQVLTPEDEKNWANAVAAYKRDGHLKSVLKHVDISRENQELILEQANVS